MAGIDQRSKQYPLRIDALSAWLILTYRKYDLMPQCALWTFKVFGKNSRNCRGLTLASKASLPSITKSNPNFSHAPMQKRAFAVDLLRWLPFGYLHRISKSKVFHVLETPLKEGLASFRVPSTCCRPGRKMWWLEPQLLSWTWSNTTGLWRARKSPSDIMELP